MSDKGFDRLAQGRLRRSAPIAGLAARTAGEAVVAALRKRATGKDQTEFHVRTAERYAELLGRSKGALMKAGQLLSFMSFGPAVPPEFQTVYRSSLSRLRADAPPMAPELARETLERELGQPTERAFAAFEFEPIAAASIGQVHRARLHDGRAVAVKVQYPGVGAAISADLQNAELLLTFLTLMGSMGRGGLRWDRRGAARELEARITEELDYRREAANQSEFADLYRGHPFIRIPEVIPERSTGRVLTQELATGLSFEQALDAEQELRDRWGEALYRFCWRNIRTRGTFNADPHPGNYLFHEDGSVTFLDFGCVKRFAADQVAAMNAVFLAAIAGDPQATWAASVEAGFLAADVSADEAFEYWREKFLMYWAEQPYTVSREYVAAAIERSYSPVGPSANVARSITASGDFLFMLRIDLGLMSVLADLCATADWPVVERECRLDDPAKTEMGKLEQAFFARREEEVAQHA
jgi:predicted unusual protein kinase regulating ubiquinone biosynthesis (AarF/ABC1/UbiB family)